MFVGGVVAGLPLLAGVGAGALAQSGTGGRGAGPAAQGATHVHPAGTAEDPVMAHLIREMAAVHNRGRSREIRGEDARAFAAQLRTLAVYSRQTDVDGRVKGALRDLIDKEGRNAVLFREPDENAMRAELKRHGFNVDERAQRPPRALDLRTRNAALETLLTGGVTATYEQIAGLLERAAPQIDRRNGSVVRVALAQDAAWWSGFCAELWEQFVEAQEYANLVCTVAAIPYVGVVAIYACIAAQSAAVFLYSVYWVYC